MGKAQGKKAEIEDIFNLIKKSKEVKKEEKKPEVKKVANKKKKTEERRGGLRQKTDEGWNIYKEDELKLDQGKDTALCPFDCECCF